MARRTSTNSSVTAAAIEILCAKHLHQSFWIPGNESRPRLRVTYSTTSNFEDASLPVVLFCHPMFGGRYTVLPFDKLAREAGIRVVVPDRPGMGGSSQVPLATRMDTWLVIVPALCQHLGIDHFHLLSHSAGTPYLLNLLHEERGSLLDTKHTYAGVMAPWVHNEHSHVAMLNLASKLPNGMLDSWNGLIKFINQRIAPSLSWSGGALSTAASVFQSASGEEDTEIDSMAKLLGVRNEVAKEAERLQGKFFFAEDTTAGNEDARLCLKMGGTNLWGYCEDYPEFMRDLVKDEEARMEADPANARLKIRVFYAESDIIIGKGGQKYFEECWSQEGCPGLINYKGKELLGTNHETILIGDKCALPAIFTEIAELSRSSSGV